MQRIRKVLFINTDEALLRKFTSAGWTAEVISSVSFVNAIAGAFIPDVVIINSISEAKIAELRKISGYEKVPVVVIGENFSEVNNLNLLGNGPKIIVCNRVIVETPEFMEHLFYLGDADHGLLPARTAKIVEYAVLFMNKNVSKELKRDAIASQVGVSEDYLTRIFRRQMGIGLWDYLKIYKMHVARKMILDGGDSLQDIAKTMGYCDDAYFSRVFKGVYGITPGSLRKD